MTEVSADTEDLTAAVERRAGVELARKLSAPKTAAAIKDLDSCYEDIFTAAAAELGHDKLVSSVLETNQPHWAQHVLSSVPDLSESHQAALAQKALVVVGEAGILNLWLADGVAFEARFTMFWKNPSGQYVLPNAATGDQGKWKWSTRLSIAINRSDPIRIPDFAIEDAPVDVGATCWVVVKIVLGKWYQLTDHSFTYKKGVKFRQFNATGAVTSPHFTLQD